MSGVYRAVQRAAPEKFIFFCYAPRVGVDGMEGSAVQ